MNSIRRSLRIYFTATFLSSLLEKPGWHIVKRPRVLPSSLFVAAEDSSKVKKLSVILNRSSQVKGEEKSTELNASRRELAKINSKKNRAASNGNTTKKRGSNKVKQRNSNNNTKRKRNRTNNKKKTRTINKKRNVPKKNRDGGKKNEKAKDKGKGKKDKGKKNKIKNHGSNKKNNQSSAGKFYYPDFDTMSCASDGMPPSYLSPVYFSTSSEECCASHFVGLIADCIINSVDGMDGDGYIIAINQQNTESSAGISSAGTGWMDGTSGGKAGKSGGKAGKAVHFAEPWIGGSLTNSVENALNNAWGGSNTQIMSPIEGAIYSSWGSAWILQTEEPTFYPSYAPTMYPTTYMPTSYAPTTSMPTTYIPTYYPTEFPTMAEMITTQLPTYISTEASALPTLQDTAFPTLQATEEDTKPKPKPKPSSKPTRISRPIKTRRPNKEKPLLKKCGPKKEEKCCNNPPSNFENYMKECRACISLC